jgi:hypothetical protein
MTQLAVIIRFKGDPDDLLERFERARQMWIEAQDGDYEPPALLRSLQDGRWDRHRQRLGKRACASSVLPGAARPSRCSSYGRAG